MLGNLGEMAKLLSRFKDIQKGMKAFRDELPKQEYVAKSSDGSVTVTMSGDFMLKQLSIAPGSDVSALEPAVMEAVNAAGLLAKDAVRSKMKEMSGGIDLDLPGLM